MEAIKPEEFATYMRAKSVMERLYGTGPREDLTISKADFIALMEVIPELHEFYQVSNS